MATQLTAKAREDGNLLSPEELRARLQAVGESRYHHLHPFHLRMHAGELTRGQLQAWALNRYYYQSRIPIKDSLLLAKSDDPAFAGRGENGSLITMGTRVVMAAWRNGSSWLKPPASRVTR